MDAFEALADPVRRDILVRVAGEARSVTDLAAAHPISRPAISRHLRVLRDAGLVSVTTVGRHRLHTLDTEGLTPILGLLAALENPPVRVAAHRLDALGLEVRRAVRDRHERPEPPNRQKDTG